MERQLMLHLKLFFFLKVKVIEAEVKQDLLPADYEA
jgi:hypothetical protein